MPQLRRPLWCPDTPAQRRSPSWLHRPMSPKLSAVEGHTMKRVIVAGCLAAVVVSGCSRAPDICTTPQPLDISPEGIPGPAEWARQRDLAEQCVHRWAYRLAGADDPATAVAAAAVGACSDLIGRTAEAWREQFGSDRGLVSYRTGQPLNAYARTFEELSMKAQFYVIQARAGRCPAPT
jgi:hypothetical protein